MQLTAIHAWFVASLEHGRLLYDGDSLNDELPYWLSVAGQSHLVIPYSQETNDTGLIITALARQRTRAHGMLLALTQVHRESSNIDEGHHA
jgi:hypothetical protein